MLMRALEAQAAFNGIDHYATVRSELIGRRDMALQNDDFDTTAFLSHVIWWMTALHEMATVP